LRIIDFYFESDQQVWMMTPYGKNEAADLTPSQKKALKAALDAEPKAHSASRAKEVRGMAKRNIFDELMEGVAAMKAHRQGKITLRTFKVEPKLLPRVDSHFIRETRDKLHCSRAVFARALFKA
jgi:hypothetical protein